MWGRIDRLPASRGGKQRVLVELEGHPELDGEATHISRRGGVVEGADLDRLRAVSDAEGVLRHGYPECSREV